jgi:hypothetical protein
VNIVRESGEPIAAAGTVVVAMSDFMAARAGAIPGSGIPTPTPQAAPLAQVRDVVARWLHARGGRVSAATFVDPTRPRWQRTPAAQACLAQAP